MGNREANDEAVKTELAGLVTKYRGKQKELPDCWDGSGALLDELLEELDQWSKEPYDYG